MFKRDNTIASQITKNTHRSLHKMWKLAHVFSLTFKDTYKIVYCKKECITLPTHLSKPLLFEKLEKRKLKVFQAFSSYIWILAHDWNRKLWIISFHNLIALSCIIWMNIHSKNNLFWNIKPWDLCIIYNYRP